MSSLNNSPVFTLYLTDSEGVQNSDNSWSWTVYWNSVFSSDIKYENYTMTHTFMQEIKTSASIPANFGVVTQVGLPTVMNSNSKGASNIINKYTTITWTDAVGYGTQVICKPNTTLFSGTHSLSSATVSLTFTQFDGSIANIGNDFVHEF